MDGQAGRQEGGRAAGWMGARVDWQVGGRAGVRADSRACKRASRQTGGRPDRTTPNVLPRVHVLGYPSVRLSVGSLVGPPDPADESARSS